MDELSRGRLAVVQAVDDLHGRVALDGHPLAVGEIAGAIAGRKGRLRNVPRAVGIEPQPERDLAGDRVCPPGAKHKVLTAFGGMNAVTDLLHVRALKIVPDDLAGPRLDGDRRQNARVRIYHRRAAIRLAGVEFHLVFKQEIIVAGLQIEVLADDDARHCPAPEDDNGPIRTRFARHGEDLTPVYLYPKIKAGSIGRVSRSRSTIDSPGISRSGRYTR